MRKQHTQLSGEGAFKQQEKKRRKTESKDPEARVFMVNPGTQTESEEESEGAGQGLRVPDQRFNSSLRV